MELTKSFYEIISKYIIEVPIIQREYAQGRNTEKVISIRKRFVNDLVTAILTDDKIHLGFVYGKIEGKENIRRKILNKEAVSSILDAVKFYANNFDLRITANIEETENEVNNVNLLKFIPLDGQQRLTTLYMLNWYLYYKGAKSQDIEWLNHFKYSNRKSSLAFCRELVNEKNISILKQKHLKNKETNIKELISNSSFFLKKWNKDATVSGMLEMLLSIEIAFDSNFDFSKIDIENLPFSFDFMDLDSLNQTDELYVKMNSRGKQLSDYEHFKSWLQEKYSDNSDKDWMDSFWLKLDTVWLNYFWRNIDTDFNNLDNFYYHYIKNLALMHCLANNTEIPFEKLKGIYSLIRNTEVYDNLKVSYISLENYLIKWCNSENEEKEFFMFNIETLKFIEKSFDSLIYLEQNEVLQNLDLKQIICKPFIENPINDFFLKANLFTPTLWNSNFYYSFIIFINDRENENFTVNAMKEWLRFTRNIIYNTQIQSPENFNNALKQINKLSLFKFNISDSIINNKVENVFFENTQFEEEKVKLQLLTNEEWIKPIFEAENHTYFYGQIKFLLDFSKDEFGNYNVQNFIKYSNNISKLYKKEIRKSNEKTLERFLLCEDFYLPHYKSDYIFCSASSGNLRTKNENWRQFFKGDKVIALKNAIDKLNGQEISNELLIDYINEYIKNNNLGSSNWKYLFLKYPQAINYCKESAIRWISDNDIRLLKGFPITAYHSELRSYCFYLQHKHSESINKDVISHYKFSPFTEFRFFEDKNTEGHPGLYLKGFIYLKKEYKLEIRYSKMSDTFELCFFQIHVESENRQYDENLKHKILNFTFDAVYNHYWKIVEYELLENELKIICELLATLN